MGRATPGYARRFVEQQCQQLPLCQPQQERAGRTQQQQRFSRGGVRAYSLSSGPTEGDFAGSTGESPERAPAMRATASENQARPGCLVA